VDYRNLGASGVKVSPLCLGTMMFGGPADSAASGRIIDRARHAGVNFIDTADQYTGGESERITGAAIKADRDWWVVATKGGNPLSLPDTDNDNPNRRGLSRAWLMQAVDESLLRLGLDHVDIYYLHLEDATTPLEETIGAVGDIIRAGKARYFGISNFRAWRHAEVVRLCDRLGVPRPAASQPYYHAFNRQPETELLPACDHYGIGVVAYSPVARGVLTGKYDPDAAPDPETRAGRKDPRMMQTEFRRDSLVMAKEFRAHAESQGWTAAQFAFAWVLNNRLVSAALAGPRTEEQLDDYIRAMETVLSPEDEALVDSMVSPGHPSSAGYNDPRYPIEGRQPRNG